MADVHRLLLDTHDSRSVTPFHGKTAVIVGVIALAGGAAAILFAADSLFLIVLGAPFVVAGMFSVIHGLIGVARNRRRDAARRDYPAEPWHGDFIWQAEGIRDEGVWRIVHGSTICLFVLMFAVAGHWLARVEPSAVRGTRLFTLWVIDAGILIGAGYQLYMSARVIKYGRSYLHFAKFPFLLGETLKVHFRNSRVARKCQRLDVTIRCIHESFGPKSRHGDVSCYQVYRDQKSIADVSRNPFGEFEIEFPLPDNEHLETRLSDRPPHYWELIVSSEVKGIDFAATFLLPVYRSG